MDRVSATAYWWIMSELLKQKRQPQPPQRSTAVAWWIMVSGAFIGTIWGFWLFHYHVYSIVVLVLLWWIGCWLDCLRDSWQLGLLGAARMGAGVSLRCCFAQPTTSAALRSSISDTRTTMIWKISIKQLVSIQCFLPVPALHGPFGWEIEVSVLDCLAVVIAAGLTGLSAHAMDRFHASVRDLQPDRLFDAGTHVSTEPNSSAVCSCCLQELKFEPVRTIKQCGHKFHNTCLRGWIVGQQKTTCPNCRAHI